MKTKSTAKFDSLEQEAYLNLWRSYDRLRAIEDEFFAHYGLTAQQYNVLRLLRAAHPDRVPTLQLGQRLVSRAPDITRMLDKLSERGWIHRERPAGNRRLVAVGITESGISLLSEMDVPLRESHLRQLGHLSEEELGQLVALLHRAREPHEDRDGIWACPAPNASTPDTNFEE
jgi:DNA-binding MarR family transcriptional regulator